MNLDLKKLAEQTAKEISENKIQVEKEISENKAKALHGVDDPYLKKSKDYDDQLNLVAKELTDCLQGKTQVVGTAADGGNRTTTATEQNLIQKQKLIPSIRNRLRVITSDQDKVDIVVENVGDFTPVKIAENARFTEQKLTYDKPRLTMAKYGLTDSISFELINQDIISPSMADQITTAMARSQVNGEEKLIIQGTTGNEIGFASKLKATASSPDFANTDADDTTTVDGIDADDLDRLIYDILPSQYLPNAVLIMRSNLLRKLLGFGNTNTQNYFIPSIPTSTNTNGVVGTYRGVPVISTQYLGDSYTTGGIAASKGSVVIIGDLNYMVRGSYAPIDIQFSDHVNFTKAQRTYRLIYTYGSQFVLNEAFATLSYRAKS
ncbi:MAG: phage major capsid protein [Candidatus Saccharibacteria bacterium]|nr:phage major capsid protein [Candidatus Saccharibacteria bacterium]